MTGSSDPLDESEFEAGIANEFGSAPSANSTGAASESTTFQNLMANGYQGNNAMSNGIDDWESNNVPIASSLNGNGLGSGASSPVPSTATNTQPTGSSSGSGSNTAPTTLKGLLTTSLLNVVFIIVGIVMLILGGATMVKRNA